MGSVELVLMIEDRKCPLTLFVTDLDEDVILGLDFQETYKSVVNVRNRTMTVLKKLLPYNVMVGSVVTV
ncbi:hypothetical protein DPMN_167712 [Dreissena polymorpha]|uniref:Uncharacterized protein n=1 Tax=Dreissena polymorpha TaxID=45954 RepID=A0A9D4IYV3_DREPO|nr:hypothetical protein DPMN_167712 [Dreissena polymorpha]